MKISFRWLERHVDLSDLSAVEVANDLTIHTAEVEGVEPFAPWLADVVVGHVVERAKHPNADKLSLCKVDVGSGELLQIVCGAANVAAGQRVAVALPGTTLPGKEKLGKSKIRGVESQGMICSERELGLSDEHEGIWVLPSEPREPRIGATVQQAIGSEDWVIEIDNKSLTHRPDCWGQRGIAREVAAIRGRALKPLDFTLPKTETGESYPVRVDSVGCSRYLGLPISGVKNGPAPAWMRFFLLAVGQRPLDLLVDLSNFVMLDLGQPNHLFDLLRLDASGIRVRDARPGETMRTLDGIERTLTADDVLIASGDEAVALAGVMGGEASRVRPETSELLLEAATFHPTRVRRTAARLGLRTDASARFEKHLDPTLPAKAAAHLVQLLRSIQPGIRLPRPRGDAGAWKDPARTIPLRPARVREVLGADIGEAETERILTSLEFQVAKSTANWSIGVPSARATKDITIEVDLIEEVGRMHGYGNIPERRLSVELAPVPWNDRLAIVKRLTDRLGGAARFHEAMTYSFLDAATAATLELESEPYVPVVNPQIEGLDRVRRSVVPSLLAHLERNRRQQSEVRLFEIGKGYLPEHANERGEPRENHELALVWMAPRPTQGARFDERVQPRLQGLLADLFRDLGRVMPSWEPLASGAPRWADPGRAMVARTKDGRHAALLAALHPEIQGRLGLGGELDGEVACAAVSLDVLVDREALDVQASSYRPLSRFPATKLDVAVAVPEERSAGEVLQALWSAAPALVVGTEVFDLYRGAAVGAGRKSLAVHVFLRDSERTLSDKDVAKYLKQVELRLAPLGGELRKE